MPEMRMPRLSESMREAVIVRWLREPGARVEPGEDLVEIETDKATVTCEAEAAGVLEILAEPGDQLTVGTPIARIGGSGPPAPGPAAAPRVKASPLARRLAREKGIDLTTLNGTGPGGRIVRADLDSAARDTADLDSAARGPAARGPAARDTAATDTAGPGAAAPAGIRGTVTVVEPTRAQQVVAVRTSAANRDIPQFTLTAEIAMDRCADLRQRLAAAAGQAPTYNDMVVRAVALALREHPRANACYDGGSFRLYGRVNVGIAVAAGDGLVVPTVFDADTRSLTGIARTTRSLAQRARADQLTPADLDGGTFTVSNLGMYGVREFTAMINPPQAAILAVGAVEQRPVVRDGQLAAGHVMSATLTCDHRILYGADAAAFLARVRELLTEPLLLLTDERGARDG